MEKPSRDSMLGRAHLPFRLDAVEQRLASHAARGKPTGLTEPDPDTPEERWEAGQVWAHIAEFVPYWHRELSSVIAAYHGTAVPFGRTKADPGRIAAIEVGRSDDVGDQMTRTADSIAELKSHLRTLTPAEWDAVGLHPTRGELDVEAMVERFIVNHLEEHADQLDTLG